jgi:predicted molibdopterin-dependent oxidoreductase YjgC
MTGNLGRPGTGLYPLRSGANSQGLADMGVRPDVLPGGQELADAETVARVEAAWGARLGGLAPGVTVDEMIAGIENGDITALYVVGADPVLAVPDDQRLRAAMQRLDFLVVQDAFLSDTAQYADVVLPASVAGEDEGTFTNGERFVQRVRAAAPCHAESRPDWKIVQTIANTLGGDWAYAAPVDVMREITEVVPAYKGLSYDRLDEAAIQWPCLATECTGTPLLFSDGFPRGKAVFAPVAQGVATVDVCRESCFVLLTGTVREHHATGVRTRRAPGITKLVRDAYLQVNPNDASALGVDSGAKVRVTASGSGASLEVPVCVSSRVPAGIVFYPGFSSSAPVTRLLTAKDRGAVAVQVERLT